MSLLEVSISERVMYRLTMESRPEDVSECYVQASKVLVTEANVFVRRVVELDSSYIQSVYHISLQLSKSQLVVLQPSSPIAITSVRSLYRGEESRLAGTLLYKISDCV